MSNRNNSMFLRAMRQLSDLRSYASQVTMIHGARQVNITSGTTDKFREGSRLDIIKINILKVEHARSTHIIPKH